MNEIIMNEIIGKISLILLIILSFIFTLFILFYLLKTFYEEFIQYRILTLYYQRSPSGLTRAISNSGMIYLSHNLRFEEQINYLYAHGYQTISMNDLIAYKEKNGKLPHKPLLIILDNGYLSTYLYTYPVIKKYGFAATMFITPDPQSDVFTQLKGIDLPLTIRQIEEISDILIGSHGMTCRSFSKLSEEELDWELKESKRQLEEILAEKVECLAIPTYDFLDRKVRANASKAGYKVIVSNRIGSNNLHTNLLQLRKLLINRDMNIQEFKRFIRPANIYRRRIIDDIKHIPALIADSVKSGKLKINHRAKLKES